MDDESGRPILCEGCGQRYGTKWEAQANDGRIWLAGQTALHFCPGNEPGANRSLENGPSETT